MKILIQTVLILVLFVPVFGQEPTASVSTPIRIMCVGDSITEGGRTFKVYRPFLNDALESAGFTFRFVGSKSTTSDGGVVLNHEGYGGKNASFLATVVPKNFVQSPADALLIHAGHNHFAKNKPVPSIVESTRKLILGCRATNPKVVVFLALVIPSKKLPKYGYIPQLNIALIKLAGELNNEDSPVVIVDHASGFDPDTMTVADKVHPNTKGAEQMSKRWATALMDHYNSL